MGAAMEPFRLRMKIGAHEFEAEGEQDSVERQFQLWRELISSIPTTSASPPPTPAAAAVHTASASDGARVGDSAAVAVTVGPDTTGYDKIFQRGGKVVSLTVLPNGENRAADAALLILLGQRHYNQTDRVTGSLLVDGLQQSGYPVGRADRVLDRYTPDLVLRDGTRRSTRWRLNNQGLNRARELARDLIAMVP
jgi:hypothetical protein